MTRILLVEDSKLQALITRRLFEGVGYTVEHVATVEEAVHRCYESRPDLVVSDQVLGEVSGLEVCRRIKSDMSLSAIPVLMLTGSHARKHHVAALDAGADAYLSKESSPDEVMAVIAHLVDCNVSVQPLVAKEEQEEATGRTAHRTRILAVDDSPTFLAALCKRLAEAGFEVTGASSGDEALELLDRQRFDVAVTDVVMPEMDGFEFAKRTRQWAVENHRQLGLLVLTGAERKDVLMQSLNAGADDYVNKSQDLDVIVAHVTALARRISRTLQIESRNQQVLRKELELQEAELQRKQAEERARLADELEQTNLALTKSNEQLKQFAHLASHDLQVSLRQVISCCETLQAKAEDRLDEESNKLIESIVQSVQNLQQLISDLLTHTCLDIDDQSREG